MPKYPKAARLKHWEGTGLLEVNLRPDGTAAKVVVLQSTGHSILDQDVTAAVQQWRFQRARDVDRVRIPVTYSLHCTH
jgi:periplasmic protein TonB